MYWTTFQGEIKRANLNGTEVEVLVEGLTNPHGIALEVQRGKMYWADGRIQRADMNGQHLELVVGNENCAPTGIELDLSNDKIYWADYRRQKVLRADLNGSNIEEIVPFTRGKPSAIALYLRGDRRAVEKKHLAVISLRRICCSQSVEKKQILRLRSE